MIYLFLALFFLIGSFFLTAEITSFRTLSQKETKTEFKILGNVFFYRVFHLFFLPEKEYEGLIFGTIAAQSLSRFCFAVFSTLFLVQTAIYQNLAWVSLILSFLIFMTLSFLIGGYFPRLLGTYAPKIAFRLAAPLASIYQLLVFPITYIFLKLSKWVLKILQIDPLHKSSTETKQEIFEIIEEARQHIQVDAHDKKLIEAVLVFRERIAREVMVPRVELFNLSAETSIKEAAEILQREGFSRTPVYKGNLDNIIGVLMYKDLLTKYMEFAKTGNDKILTNPIESITKNALYTPETKKLSSLLQEFRKKQVHLAIVVDEYGGTEGIVTIEDILEEIVGDISDEYDKEETLYKVLPNGSIIVDARMNILDIEEELNINIPQESDYDTLGGFIYQTTGTIPSKGFIIHHDDFEIEILSSNEKSVEKVIITPISI